MKLPGLIDPHVHVREPGAVHKEDWATGTAAALAGGFTTVLAMPNTHPPIIDSSSLNSVLDIASRKAHCDYAQYLGAGHENYTFLPALAKKSAGLKMYLDQTYGPLCLDDLTYWMAHFAHWPATMPVVAHAEVRTMAAVMLLASLYDRQLHLAHVSRREEILLIRKAKERGLRVTCEVSPHHLFLCEDDIPDLGRGRSEVRPRLASAIDQTALWNNLDVIDCFASDHAPHTLGEKDSADPPPGFPGLETSLPLFLTAVHEGRLSLEDVITRMYTNPQRIFKIPEQSNTWIEVDFDSAWEISESGLQTRCRWTPFRGWRVHGRIISVVLRGDTVYKDGIMLAKSGYGRNIRSTSREVKNEE
jgi:carbamoyl-phosphate synthase/aspartate carbamoyltransferase/dihydroorotase